MRRERISFPRKGDATHLGGEHGTRTAPRHHGAARWHVAAANRHAKPRSMLLHGMARELRRISSMKPAKTKVVRRTSVRLLSLATLVALVACRRPEPTHTQPGEATSPGTREVPTLDAGSNEPIGPIAQGPAGGSATGPTLPPILPPPGGAGGYGGTTSPIGTIARR
jgi:hypothetical protein